MQAVAFTQTGAPEVLRVLEVLDPTPGSGQVRVQVKGSGVNFRDIGVRRDGTNEGSRTPQPVITGIEAAGVVESLGTGVTAPWPAGGDHLPGWWVRWPPRCPSGTGGAFTR